MRLCSQLLTMIQIMLFFLYKVVFPATENGVVFTVKKLEILWSCFVDQMLKIFSKNMLILRYQPVEGVRGM